MIMKGGRRPMVFWFSLIASIAPVVDGHGGLMQPPSRNAIDRHLPAFRVVSALCLNATFGMCLCFCILLNGNWNCICIASGKEVNIFYFVCVCAGIIGV